MKFDKVNLYFLSFNMYNFSAGLIGVFINLFILATSSLLNVIYFNILYYGGLEIAYFASIYALDYLRPKDLYVAGSAIRAITLATMMIAAALVSNVLAFGLLYGVSIGTFWLGNNILNTDVSKGMDRNRFVYMNSLLGGITGFAAPMLAGMLIQYSQFAGPLKFAFDFAAAIIVLLASAYSMHVAKLGKPTRPLKFRMKDTIIEQRGYANYKTYFLLWQMFALPFSLILPVYVFVVTNNYIITGAYTSGIVLITIFANYLNRITKKYWNGFVKLGVAAIIVSSLLLLMPEFINPLFAVMLFTFVYSLFSTPLNNQASVNFLSLIDGSAMDRVYFWINREYYFTSGRAIAFAAMVILLLYAPGNLAYLIYLIPPMCLYSLAYMSVSAKEADGQIKWDINIVPRALSLLPIFNYGADKELSSPVRTSDKRP